MVLFWKNADIFKSLCENLEGNILGKYVIK